MANLSDISDYMEVLLQSEFLQFNLLSAKDFAKFLRDHGISLSLKELEYYDKKDILRPALRLRLPTIDDHPSQKYANVSSNSFSIKYCYTQGLVEFPKGGDFQPWESYTDGHEERVRLLYHMYQFVPIRQLIMGNNIVLSPQFFEEVKDLQRSLGGYKERIAEITKIAQTSSKKWVPKVGLLMLLQEAYGFGYYNGTLMADPQLRS